MSAHPTWSIADLLDLEYFLDADKKSSMAGQEEKLHRRDRKIHEEIAPLCAAGSPRQQRACLLRHWLERRREQEQAGDVAPLPGQIFTELVRIGSWLLCSLALVSGWGLAFSFLSYSGTAPINVATFLTIFVASQLLLLFILLFFLAAGRLKTRPALPLTYSLVRRGLLVLLRKLGRLAFTRGSRWLQELSGNIHAYGDMYGLIFMFPIFLLVQLAAVCFNLGILAALIFKVLTTDLAFGWQTTLQTGAVAVARLVELLALPWSWLLPAGTGYPDPAQIQGSHIILKEGISQLSSTALTSWWPFLCLCLIVYGLLPRLALYLSGRIALTHLLRTFRFDGARHQQLLQRMQTPVLTTTEKAAPRQPLSRKREQKTASPQPTGAIPARALLLIPEELADEYDPEALSKQIRRQTGYKEIETHFFDPAMPVTSLCDASLSSQPNGENRPVLILQEAWQPPINEFLHFLTQLRTTVGDTVSLFIFLIGQPDADAGPSPPREQDRTIWIRTIAAQGDPRLDVSSFRRS